LKTGHLHGLWRAWAILKRSDRHFSTPDAARIARISRKPASASVAGWPLHHLRARGPGPRSADLSKNTGPEGPTRT